MFFRHDICTVSQVFEGESGSGTSETWYHWKAHEMVFNTIITALNGGVTSCLHSKAVLMELFSCHYAVQCDRCLTVVSTACLSV